MSIGDGGNDDLEDKIEDLIDEIGNLTEMMEFLVSPQAQEVKEQTEDTGPEDSWDEGTSTAVRSVDEFKKWRRRAATEEGVSTPYFATSDLEDYDSKLKAHVNMYMKGFQNLQELYSTLGVSEFDDFIQEFAKMSSDPTVASNGVIADELIDILDPSASFFGIQVIEGEVEINPALTPFSFIEAYGYTWHAAAEPMKKLGLREPEDVVPVIGSITSKEINSKMAKTIDRRDDLELPDKYSDLL
jgi:hypothetical protein